MVEETVKIGYVGQKAAERPGERPDDTAPPPFKTDVHRLLPSV